MSLSQNWQYYSIDSLSVIPHHYDDLYYDSSWYIYQCPHLLINEIIGKGVAGEQICRRVREIIPTQNMYKIHIMLDPCEIEEHLMKYIQENVMLKRAIYQIKFTRNKQWCLDNDLPLIVIFPQPCEGFAQTIVDYCLPFVKMFPMKYKVPNYDIQFGNTCLCYCGGDRTMKECLVYQNQKTILGELFNDDITLFRDQTPLIGKLV